MKEEPAPITKDGLLAAINTAIDLLPRYTGSCWQHGREEDWDSSFLANYLENLRKDILNDRWKNE